MAFQVSAGINIQEIDLTNIIPAVSTTEAAIGGVFSWGPVEYRELISSEEGLVNLYGMPTSNNFETFLTASSFLAYGDSLHVSRAASNTAFNAVVGSNSSVSIANTQIKNIDDYNANYGTYNANAIYIAKYPGSVGNSLKISVCDSANAYSSTLSGNTDSVANLSFYTNSNTATLVVTSATSSNNANAALTTIVNGLTVGDYISAGNSTVGNQLLKITSIGVPSAAYQYSNGTSLTNGSGINITFNTTYSLSQNTSGNTVNRLWEYYNFVDRAPGTSPYVQNLNGSNDELHVVITDEDGLFSGSSGQILEVWSHLSRALDAKSEQGGTLYYADFLKTASKYVWVANHRANYSVNTAPNITGINTLPFTQSFVNGTYGSTETTISLSNLTKAYDQFKNPEDADISLFITGKAKDGVLGEALPNYIIDNIVETRKDSVVFVSPRLEASVNNPTNQLNDTKSFQALLHGSSYAFVDSGYKYMYDKYNDIYRWVPLNGDIAGLVVRTDQLRDPWFSPAGFNRGQIKNVVRLAYNPGKADRDELYKNSINPVVNFPGQGPILYGDKTNLGRPSAFDRINVRRLFIVLEKAISIAAQASLFELNDDFTRAQFRNLVEPYLRDVKGRRGIYDFRVVCDSTNNTPERIDRNEFWGDIYIKPNRSINFLNLRFVAVRTGVSFDEIVNSI